MENNRFIICVLVFICTIAGAYARPSKGKGKSDDVAWYNYACWINQFLFGKDGPALIN